MTTEEALEANLINADHYSPNAKRLGSWMNLTVEVESGVINKEVGKDTRAETWVPRWFVEAGRYLYDQGADDREIEGAIEGGPRSFFALLRSYGWEGDVT